MKIIGYLFVLAGTACSGGGADVGLDTFDSKSSIDCTNGSLGLHFDPGVLVQGTWRGGGRDGPCTDTAGGGRRCPAGEVGETEWISCGNKAVVYLATSATVEGLDLTATDVPNDATVWFSNGFQSWSQSGALAIGAPTDETATAKALAAQGDAETLRKGSELSWWYTAVGGGSGAPIWLWAMAQDGGAVGTGWRWIPWTQVSRTPQGLRIRLGCGGTGGGVAAGPGDAVYGQPWAIGLGPPSDLDRPPQPRSIGWNSWYQLWDSVDESAIRANATLISGLVKTWVTGTTWLELIVDDGWEQQWGQWTTNDKFPSGLNKLRSDLAVQGIAMGVWLAPLLVSEQSPLVQQHPNWFVAGQSYNHLKRGPMRILDVSQPEAAAHLAATIHNLSEQGLSTLKIDFLFAGTYPGGRAAPVTGMEAYEIAMQIIRSAAGPKVRLIAVGAPLGPTLKIADAWRMGPDIALEPIGPNFAFLVNELRALSVRFPVCRALACDADPPLLRAPLTPAEVQFGQWTVAVASGGWMLSDDLRTLPADRTGAQDPIAVAQATGARPGIPAEPWGGVAPATLASALGDFGAGSISQVVPRIWLLPDGRQVRFNTGDAPSLIGGGLVDPHGVGRGW